jgi:carboxymethylenebutenolidase
MPSPKEHASESRCPVLGLFGGADPVIPAEHRDEFERGLSAAGVDHEIISYPGAPHSFFDRTAADHADACEDAWRRVLGFLDTVAAPSRT